VPLGMSPLAHYVVETLVTLLAIVALAVVVLIGARRAGMGRSAGPLELVGRLPLDARRAVYLVRVGTVIYVVGASEAGIAKLGEVAEGAIELPTAPNPSETFREVLSRALGKKS
jgi:flagellar protein FliO/FliZ